MQSLFLVFLAAAWLNEGVLAIGLAPDPAARRASASLGLATGAAVLMTVLSLATPDWTGTVFKAGEAGTRLLDFLFALSFACVLLQLASGRARPARLNPGAQQWRVALPLLSGNLAVLAQAITGGSQRPVATLAASIGLSFALALLAPAATAVLDRLHVSTVPTPMRGTPVIILSAALAAVALTGLAPVLPW
ncbi:MAG: hypothetical protein A3E01_17050 [Gammaproteobacteria bacterium RIFCSPHIGHO2_12_FULL_63_22]|nr:MAG: hypothetical protein A3E01_17050 [Gammaproteobacteria bacterium RIFCSPHIGHO2_12_FULL_63_22]